MLVPIDIGGRTLLFEQIADIDKLIERAIVEHTHAPYWACLWPSARALAQWAGTRLELQGKRIIEIGCGLGAVGIACAAQGARATVSDASPDAIAFSRKNAERNGVLVETLVFDWNTPPPDLGTFDAIFAADVFYEDGMLASVIRFLKAHLAPEGEAFIADPMRVLPSGVVGAARFRGLWAESEVLLEPGPHEKGVQLFRIRRRRSPA